VFLFISLLGLCFCLSLFLGLCLSLCFIVDLRCSLFHFIELEPQRLDVEIVFKIIDLAHQTRVHYT